MPGFLLIEGDAYPVALQSVGKGGYRGAGSEYSGDVACDGDHIWVHYDGQAYDLVWQDAVTHFAEAAGIVASDVARAPMPGSAVSVLVAAGGSVTAGETMMVIESMKLETAIGAPRDGRVEIVHVAIGQSFERDALLVSLGVEP